MVLQYLYKNWSHAGILIAPYVTLVLLCMAPFVDLFTLLVWLQFPVYLVHEFEEHTYPGGFKEFVNKVIFHVYDRDIPLNVERVFWLNILAVWFVFPLSAVGAQFVDPSIGFIPVCFSLVNASLHILGGVMRRAYNPGLLASMFLNYPAALYALHVAHRQEMLTLSSLANAFLFAIVVHLITIGVALYWYHQYKKRKVGV